MAGAAYRGLPSGYDRYVGDISTAVADRLGEWLLNAAVMVLCLNSTRRHAVFLNLAREDRIDPVECRTCVQRIVMIVIDTIFLLNFWIFYLKEIF